MKKFSVHKNCLAFRNWSIQSIYISNNKKNDCFLICIIIERKAVFRILCYSSDYIATKNSDCNLLSISFVFLTKLTEWKIRTLLCSSSTLENFSSSFSRFLPDKYARVPSLTLSALSSLSSM